MWSRAPRSKTNTAARNHLRCNACGSIAGSAPIAARGLAWIRLPQASLFQIAFAAISPLIDRALLAAVASTAIKVSQHGWAQTQTDVLTMAVCWVVFTAIDIGCGWVVYRLDSRRIRYPAWLLAAQRFVYRKLMCWGVLRAIGSAVAGMWVGWAKLERTGRVGSGGAPVLAKMT